MEIIDIIAILGALAWLPQIISWVYNWLKKPKISIYHDGEAEVGYIKMVMYSILDSLFLQETNMP